MNEHAGLPPVAFREERPVGRVRERSATDVREEHDALQAQLVEGARELAKRAVRVVHRDGGEAQEPPGPLRDEVGVRVVHHARDLDLRPALGEEDVRGREREDLHVDAHAVHVLEALADVRHRRRDPEEARALVADDPLPGRARAEREVAAAPLDALEVRRRVVVGVEVELHRRPRER